LLDLLVVLESISQYPATKAIPVKTTKSLLYFDKLPKNANPDAPKPREANIKPPLQQREAAKAVKTDAMLINFCFILIILS
jgi:hypothetical protein